MLTLARILKRRALVAAFVVLLSGVFVEVVAQRESRSAPRFVSVEGRFSISLPDKSSFTTLIIPTPFGNARGNWYEWQTKEATFGVGYADSFQPINDPEAVKQFFDGATERFRKLVEAKDGKIAVVKKITLDKYSGIEQRAELFAGSFIQRTYLVSQRIYETNVAVKYSQGASAVEVLDTFKLLSDPEITEEALKAGPGPLPQTPEAPRAGSDAGDEGLRGPVKSVRTEIQYLSETEWTKTLPRFSITTYNEKGNQLREESYDFKNNLVQITVFGYLDGGRVSASKSIQREYDAVLPVRRGIGAISSNKEMDPRYQHRFEYKYDEKKRLIEQTDLLSNGEFVKRQVYKYEAKQKEELVYSETGSLTYRELYILDDKNNEIEDINFEPDGSVNWKISYTYEFDSHGNWTKQTMTVLSDRHRRIEAPSVHLRTITYY